MGVGSSVGKEWRVDEICLGGLVSLLGWAEFELFKLHLVLIFLFDKLDPLLISTSTLSGLLSALLLGLEAAALLFLLSKDEFGLGLLRMRELFRVELEDLEGRVHEGRVRVETEVNVIVRLNYLHLRILVLLRLRYDEGFFFEWTTQILLSYIKLLSFVS